MALMKINKDLFCAVFAFRGDAAGPASLVMFPPGGRSWAVVAQQWRPCTTINGGCETGLVFSFTSNEKRSWMKSADL